MSIRNLIILSQLNPPAQRTRILRRERVDTQIQKATNYPLTIIEAGTGYGKSTAVSSLLADIKNSIYWFAISGSDRDPKLFFAKLFSAFNQGEEKLAEEALRILDSPDATTQEAIISFLNALSINLEKESLLIMDDFHQVGDVSEIISRINWMIDHLPTKLHVVVATRHFIEFPDLNKWRVKNNVLEISRETLAFTDLEIKQLFEEQYEINLSDLDLSLLSYKTEGWAIGLQMVWQTLQRNPEMSISQVLEDDRLSRSALFEYLAEEIFAGLTPDIQVFLLWTSILSKMDSATCDFLLNREDSEKVLRYLGSSGLFIEELRPGVYRYHQIFREFLLTRLKKDSHLERDLHQKIASYFRVHEYWEEAIYHLLEVGDYKQVNLILESIGETMIKEGRHETVRYWIYEIPDEFKNKFPYIQLLLGEVNRFLGKFEEALEHYHLSERLFRNLGNRIGLSLALQGQAQIFLDTIRPINADQLLQDALSLLDPTETPKEVANLLVLTAENQLNLGYPESAENLLTRAKSLQSGMEKETDIIQGRILLRTGQLEKGICLLAESEPDHLSMPLSRPQRFHREGALLLSLFFAIKGDHEKSEYYARKGIQLGDKLNSSFVQSVGYMRLGHALSLKLQDPLTENGYDLAINYYKESIEKVDVVRIHVEPLWGICKALGYSGRIEEAKLVAQEALSIAQKAGDRWISLLIQLSIGAGCVLAGDFQAAQQYLTTAETIAVQVKDPFLLSAAYLWLSLKSLKQGFTNTAFRYFEKMVPIITENTYEFILQRETLMGLSDREQVIPLLIAAKGEVIAEEFIHKILHSKDLETIKYHPGYSLWVRTFGNFTVWRGSKLIDRQDWKREKSLHLFQILIANRDKWLEKEQIFSFLWPESEPDNISNYFKVVFNTLNDVLEPNRPKGEAPFFIIRDQERYRINPKARIIIDVDLFMESINNNRPDDLEYALNLYKGHYFSDSTIQQWLMIEDQYYHQKYLLSADGYLKHLLEEGHYEKALRLTHEVLAQDNLWESTYRTQMIIFHETKQFDMIQKVFHQCKKIFKDQIQQEISQETKNLYTRLTKPH
jgi:ATP/maltotriose-dependent transcriptional regulator MalT/DNA-binding SARP family transcriptional activator